MGVASRFKGKLKGLNFEKIESGAVGNGEWGEQNWWWWETGKEEMEIVGSCMNNSKASL